MTDLKALSEAATASSRAMAGELTGRIGVKRLIEIWEQHQTDVQAWAKAVNEAHDAEIKAAVLAEREACAEIAQDMIFYLGDDVANSIRARGEGEP